MKVMTRWLFAMAMLCLAAGNVAGSGLPNGTVFNVPGAPELYLSINGYAAHIPSMRVYQCMGLEKNRSAKVSQHQLNAMPKTAFLIRGSDRRIYRVDGEIKRHVPNLKVFRKKGFNEGQVIDTSDRAVACIAEGPPLH